MASHDDGAGSARLRPVHLAGPVMCGLGALAMLAALAVDLDSTAARVLIASSAILFVPGAYLTLAVLRHVVGPPR